MRYIEALDESISIKNFLIIIGTKLQRPNGTADFFDLAIS